MKKKVIYVFSLILYLLIVSTILSQKIEVEMCTQVEISERKYTGHVGAAFSVSTDALFVDEEGEHLYEIVDGSGWESGSRIQEISDSVWSMGNYGKLSLPNGRSYCLVESASRQPVEGEMALIVKIPGRTKDYVPFTDQYLVYYPGGVPEDFVLPDDSQIIAQSDTAVLLDMSDIVYPFFEQRAKHLSASMENENCRVFSMTEVETFLEQLPKVVALAVCLLLPVVIWIFSGVMVREAFRYKKLLLVNVGIAVIFLCVAIGILGQIDFPASLMPIDNIFDGAHYAQEFSMIEAAQSSLK